ncbi:histidine kinase [Kribbella sp. NPDC048915]|uniref:sensor histidine kinase n=1 Tax=Kribbella sp. NPDC048915 TaxID=3155148 RepID=UPI0033E40F75
MRRSARGLSGLLAGSALAPVELVLVGLSVLALVTVVAVPRARSRVERVVQRCARSMAAMEVRRLGRFHQVHDLGPYDDSAAFAYLLRRWPIGALGALVVLLLLYGLAIAATMVSAWAFDGSWGYIESADRVSTETLMLATVPGALLLYINVMGLAGVVDLDVKLARRHLTPSVEEALTRRISELTVSRAEVVEVVNEERRRIERDLHDGLQQRLVALGLLLSRARRARESSLADDLVRQAHAEAELALVDLRDVAWRVYPTALDKLGLREVLAVLTERSSIPVRLEYTLSERPPAGVETAAYFVISEALTNAAKHSQANKIAITVTPTPADDERPGVLVTVTDDGVGGADVSGRGLSGLAGRVVASDGRLTVSSPRGGPTTIRAEFLCA